MWAESATWDCNTLWRTVSSKSTAPAAPSAVPMTMSFAIPEICWATMRPHGRAATNGTSMKFYPTSSLLAQTDARHKRLFIDILITSLCTEKQRTSIICNEICNVRSFARHSRDRRDLNLVARTVSHLGDAAGLSGTSSKINLDVTHLETT